MTVYCTVAATAAAMLVLTAGAGMAGGARGSASASIRITARVLSRCVLKSGPGSFDRDGRKGLTAFELGSGRDSQDSLYDRQEKDRVAHYECNTPSAVTLSAAHGTGPWDAGDRAAWRLNGGGYGNAIDYAIAVNFLSDHAAPEQAGERAPRQVYAWTGHTDVVTTASIGPLDAGSSSDPLGRPMDEVVGARPRQIEAVPSSTVSSAGTWALGPDMGQIDIALTPRAPDGRPVGPVQDIVTLSLDAQ